MRSLSLAFLKYMAKFDARSVSTHLRGIVEVNSAAEHPLARSREVDEVIVHRVPLRDRFCSLPMNTPAQPVSELTHHAVPSRTMPVGRGRSVQSAAASVELFLA